MKLKEKESHESQVTRGGGGGIKIAYSPCITKVSYHCNVSRDLYYIIFFIFDVS